MKTKYKLLLLIAPLSVIIDQWSKISIESSFKYVSNTKVLIPGLFSLTYVRNRGAAFGICSTCPPVFRDNFFLVVPVVALIVIGYVLYKLKGEQKWVTVALSLILSGAIGNLIDRARLGYVIDFLDFYVGTYHWPAFNVADSCIVCGVFMMFIHSLFPQKFGLSPTGDSTASS